MSSFLLRRVLRAFAIAAGIGVLSFLLLHARSEEAVRTLAESRGLKGPEALDALRHDYGLDRPLARRLLEWTSGVLQGDFGESWSRPGSSVREVLVTHLPLTLALTGSGLILQILMGLVVAAASVRLRGTWKESILQVAILGINALPEFCVGILLLWPLSVRLGWFPLSGAASAPWETAAGGWTALLDRLHHLILPATCLGLAGVATVARLLRVRWEEELGARYVRGARARGIATPRILWLHGLRNAAGPLCTAVGLSLPALVGGAVIVEQVFNWPGLGRVLVGAVASRDLNLLAGANVFLAVLVCAGGVLSDLLWAGLDPRVRAS